MLWSRSSISPADWVGILKVEIGGIRGKSTIQDCLDWLEIRNCEIFNPHAKRADMKPTRWSRNTLAKMFSTCAAIHGEPNLLPKNEARFLGMIIETISASVSFKSCVCYFEDLAYRGMKFFLPQGDLDETRSNYPSGLYQGSRYSLLEQGKIVRSAFLFYTNKTQAERLYGYAKSPGSGILRFKELRLISNPNGDDYQIISGGLVFGNRQCFIAIGATYETKRGIPEDRLKASDILHAQTVYYVFDDDGDADVIRGIKIGALRMDGDPVAPVIELQRIKGTILPVNWSEIANSKDVEIGVFSPNSQLVGVDSHLKKIAERLEISPDSESHMLRVSTYKRTSNKQKGDQNFGWNSPKN